MEYEIYDAEFEGVFVNAVREGFVVSWNSNKGFGQFCFTKDRGTNEFEIDNEFMSKKFIKEVLNKLVDNAKLTSDG